MQTVLQHIFGQQKLEAVPLEALQQLTKKYPFFAPAQYLLARKLYETGNEGFDPQLKMTALHFQNPLWLEHLLEIPVDTAQAEISRNRETPVEEPEPAEEAAVQPPAPEPASEVTSPEPLIEIIPELVIALVPENPVESARAAVAEEPVMEPDPEELPLLEEQEVAPLSEQPLLKDILQKPVEATDTLEITAFHTIDYFASQGIRLQTGSQQGDKLDRQMKSFTEWLKTMRRLPEARMEQLEKVNEEAIQQQASGSLEEREVVTETMAEVLVKQRHLERAIRIYQKLGLQHPAKSAYFAAKIEALKS